MAKKEKKIEECRGCKFIFTRNRQDIPMAPGGEHLKNYFCRRYPPTEAGIIQVAPSGWCGEYK